MLLPTQVALIEKQKDKKVIILKHGSWKESPCMQGFEIHWSNTPSPLRRTMGEGGAFTQVVLDGLHHSKRNITDNIKIEKQKTKKGS